MRHELQKSKLINPFFASTLIFGAAANTYAACPEGLTAGQTYSATTDCSASPFAIRARDVAVSSVTVDAGVTIEGSGTVANDNGGVVLGVSVGLTPTDSSSIDILINNGTIQGAGGTSGIGLSMWGDVFSTRIGTLTNNGTIAGQYGVLLVNDATIDTFENSAGASIIGNVGGDALRLFTSAQIGTLTNAGTISGGTFGINVIAGTVAQLSNTGTISGSTRGINNAATITTFNNAQSNLTYQGTLPTNYNVIVNSFSNYGKLIVTSPAGSTNFGVARDSSLTAGTYTDVVSGVTNTNFSTLAGTYGGYRWLLSDSDNNNAWDLTLSGNVAYSTNAEGNKVGLPAARVIDQNDNLLALFNEQTSAAQQSDAVTQTLPLLTGASQVAASTALTGINRVIQARQEANRGLSSGDDFYGDKNVWMKPFGSRTDQDNRRGVSGYEAKTWGLAFGADATISDKTRLGASFAYAKASTNGNSNVAPNSMGVDVYQLVGYGSHALDADSEINFQIGLGQNQNDGKRRILFAGTTAKSDYSSLTATTGVGYGRTYNLSEKTKFLPSVRADYNWIKDKGYTEKGAGALNLNVKSRTTDELILAIDGKVTHEISKGTTLSANLGIGYDALNEQASITATFAGAPGAAFTTKGLDPSPWMVRGGLGIVSTTQSGMEVSARFDADYRKDFLNQTASVKLRWAF